MPNGFNKVLVFISLTKQNDDELFFEGYVKDLPCENLHFTFVRQKSQATVFDNKFIAAQKASEYVSKMNWLWCESFKVVYEEVKE